MLCTVSLAATTALGAQRTPTPTLPPVPRDTMPVVLSPMARDTVSAAVGARPITLAEAVRLARTNSPQTVQARGTERADRAAVRSAFGAFLPSVSVSTGAGRAFGARAGGFDSTGVQRGSVWTYSNGLTVSAELFNGQNFGALGAARANANAAEAGIVTENYAVAVSVAQQYYNALSARESEIVARTQLAQAEQQLAASVRQVRAGAATRSDSLRSFVQVANARVALLTAQTNLRSADAALTRLTGSAEPVTPVLEDTGTTVPGLPNGAALDSGVLDSATLTRLALQGPAVAQAQAQLAAANADRAASRGAYLPTVSASYSRSGTGIDSRFGLGPDPFAYGGQLSFSISYPLFDRFTREEQGVRAQVAQANATVALRDAELAAKQLAVQDRDALRTALERVDAQRAAVTAAEEDLRVQQARYDLGLSTIVDVLTSQTQLNQAHADLIAARYDARIARVQIEALIGRDLGTTSSTNAGTPR